uniref:Uncharacterized protein n=1 Tax=Parascaris univalens TaxID=6257 RepID=A0A915ADN3_PARUN
MRSLIDLCALVRSRREPYASGAPVRLYDFGSTHVWKLSRSPANRFYLACAPAYRWQYTVTSSCSPPKLGPIYVTPASHNRHKNGGQRLVTQGKGHKISTSLSWGTTLQLFDSVKSLKKQLLHAEMFSF